MPYKLKRLTGDEFVRKVLSGERDFKQIRLGSEFDLSGHDGYESLQTYLKDNEQMLRLNPVNISESQATNLIAVGLHLPYVLGFNTDLRGSDLSHAYLLRSNLDGANLRRTNLSGSRIDESGLNSVDFQGANLEGANLRASYLGSANFRKTNLRRTNMRYAGLGQAQFGYADLENARFESAILTATDLRHAKNLETVGDLAYAQFNRTIVSEKEKAIIERALKDKQLFDVR